MLYLAYLEEGIWTHCHGTIFLVFPPPGMHSPLTSSHVFWPMSSGSCSLKPLLLPSESVISPSFEPPWYTHVWYFLHPPFLLDCKFLKHKGCYVFSPPCLAHVGRTEIIYLMNQVLIWPAHGLPPFLHAA